MWQISENAPTLDRNAQWNQLLLPASSKFVVVLDFAGLPALYRLENISGTKPMSSSCGFVTWLSSSWISGIRAG